MPGELGAPGGRELKGNVKKEEKMQNEIIKSTGGVAPAENYRLATDVAGVCREIVSRTAKNIRGKKYVCVEGWMSIAAAHGCVASTRDVEAVSGGIRAIGEIRKMDTGSVIATAEGFVGDDEKMWAARPLYARRAMAQTRAISRACRSAFAHVVVLIDEHLSTTPAEEVPSEGFEVCTSKSCDERSSSTPAESKGKVPPGGAVEKHSTGQPEAKSRGWRDAVVHFGKNKGKKLSELDACSLHWYVENWYEKKVAEMETNDISPSDRRLFDAVENYRREKAEGNRPDIADEDSDWNEEDAK